MSKQTQEIAAAIDVAFLDTLKTPQAVAQYFETLGVNVADNDADGIKVVDILDDKDRLIGVPFIMLGWDFNKGSFGDFVSIEAMLSDGSRIIINDGSTGIAKQVRELTEHRQASGHPSPFGGRMVRNGLRKSDYEVTIVNPKGDEETIPATTYYLAY